MLFYTQKLRVDEAYVRTALCRHTFWQNFHIFYGLCLWIQSSSTGAFKEWFLQKSIIERLWHPQINKDHLMI